LILQHILIAATAKTAVAARGLSNHTSKKLNQEVADEASHLLATIAVKPSMYKKTYAIAPQMDIPSIL
jgi:hypothetical protein